MLISGISLEQSKYLTNLKIVSTKNITVLFLPFKDRCLSFVLTIYRPSYTNSDKAKLEVTSLVKVCIQDLPAVMRHISKSTPLLKDRVMKDLLANILVSFIEVKRSNANDGNFRGWNVYLNHLYLVDDDYIKLIQLIRSCQFPSATTDFSLLLHEKDTLLYTNCKSIDHDMLNYLFLNLLG